MQKKKAIAIVTPIYKHSFSDIEKFSFYHNSRMLQNRDIFLLGPKRLEGYLNRLKSTLDNCYVTIVEDFYFDDTYRGNSRLMMTREFYNYYSQYEYILICHFDAIVFQDNLDYWMAKNYDYVGAPRFKSLGDKTNIIDHGNNGGLSLRKTASYIKVLSQTGLRYSKFSSIWKFKHTYKEKLRYLWYHGLIYNYKLKSLRPILHEDIYWSFIVPDRFKWFKNAPFEEARFFAFEEYPKLLYELNGETYPFGIHAWWKYDKKFCNKMLKDAFPNISIPIINESEC